MQAIRSSGLMTSTASSSVSRTAERTGILSYIWAHSCIGRGHLPWRLLFIVIYIVIPSSLREFPILQGIPNILEGLRGRNCLNVGSMLTPRHISLLISTCRGSRAYLEAAVCPRDRARMSVPGAAGREVARAKIDLCAVADHGGQVGVALLRQQYCETVAWGMKSHPLKVAYTETTPLIGICSRGWRVATSSPVSLRHLRPVLPP